MIIVKLMGGLGNQMFQYALGRRLSLLRKTDLKTDISFLNDKSYSHISREFELDIFSAPVSIATEKEMNKFQSVQSSKFKKAVQYAIPFIHPFYIIGEPTKEYNAAILNSPKNSLMIGYWQTEKYFLPIQNIIRNDFTFKNPLEGINKKLAESMNAVNSVSVHIRRGDYVHSPETNQFHGTCSPEYYYAALNLIKTKTSNPHLYIFSDDMEWVKTNMQFDFPVTYVNNNAGSKSYIDMQLMSLCKHNVIANSSFSWWGAWLNNNPGKLVIAPARWFNDTSVNVKDIIPEGWQKL